MKLPDQRLMWDKKFAAGEHDEFRNQPSELAEYIHNTYLKDKSKVLDLGCGNGRDAVYFAKFGHDVTGVDFSKFVIDKNNALYKYSNLDFKVFDMAKDDWSQLPKSDLVYAFLSLHYFDNATTDKIIGEIHNNLYSGGILAFVCKANDPKRMDGAVKLDENTYIKNNHIRHFFTEEYVRNLLTERFIINELRQEPLYYVDRETDVIVCIANKI